jgi:hypothetical protein
LKTKQDISKFGVTLKPVHEKEKFNNYKTKVYNVEFKYYLSNINTFNEKKITARVSIKNDSCPYKSNDVIDIVYLFLKNTEYEDSVIIYGLFTGENYTSEIKTNKELYDLKENSNLFILKK